MILKFAFLVVKDCWRPFQYSAIFNVIFQDDKASSVTISSKRKFDMLISICELNLIDHEDGATAHSAKQSLEAVWQMLIGPFILLSSDKMNWSARSPDLTPYDFFSCVYQEADVFKYHRRILKKLKTAIWEDFMWI